MTVIVTAVMDGTWNEDRSHLVTLITTNSNTQTQRHYKSGIGLREVREREIESERRGETANMLHDSVHGVMDSPGGPKRLEEASPPLEVTVGEG